MKRHQHIAILGLGLIGGSLGQAIRRQRLADTVSGWSRRLSTLETARRIGAIDIGSTRLHDVVKNAGLVVLAPPVDAIVPLGLSAARSMPRNAILTDAGSVKGPIVEAFERRLRPRTEHIVGGHPIAGSERRGLAAAQAQLFQGTLGILTPTRRTNPEACEVVAALWRGVGQQVIRLSPTEHDQLLAMFSHLPHAIAACLVSSASSGLLPQTPRSFLDMTRVAKSDPDLWDDIFLANRSALLKAMTRFEREWKALRGLVEHGQRAAIKRRLAAVQRRRLLLDPERA